MAQNDEDKPKGVLPVPRLRSVKSTRQTMARYIRAYAAREIEDTTFKTIIYGLAQYQSYLRLEAEVEFEKRLEALEARLEGRDE